MEQSPLADAPVLVEVERDGFVESVHRGHVIVTDAEGAVHAAAGDPALEVYPRSSLKPFQALATAELLAEAGAELDVGATAITCASHHGSSDHQVEAARILAGAGLDEDALRCPAAYPSDRAAAMETPAPTRLAHNCSGKHAGFLAAQVAAGEDPEQYLDGEGRLQRLGAERATDYCGTELTGSGVDGCGAPAWRLQLQGMATGFARLAGAAGDHPLAPIAAAMRARPDLVGGMGNTDTQLMLSDGRVVAKGGAEAFFAVGFSTPQGALGVAVKISDGGSRALGPIVGTVLQSYGMHVDDAVVAPVVLGGGLPHGKITAVAAVRELSGQGG